MKRFLTLFFILIGFWAGAQNLPYVIKTPTQYTEAVFDKLGIPNDTPVISTQYGRNLRPWLGRIGDDLYMWSVSQQKWVAVGGGGGGSFDTTLSHSYPFYDTKFVHLTGNETIAGVKTFSNQILGSAGLVTTTVDAASNVTAPSFLATYIASMGPVAAGKGAYYFKTDGLPYGKNAAGTEMPLYNAGEASFTETTQEFTGSTSMSITLSNTPKSGKAEMYFLNGVAIAASNVLRTGTGVTLSGFTRWSSDVITAKYSY